MYMWKVNAIQYNSLVIHLFIFIKIMLHFSCHCQRGIYLTKCLLLPLQSAVLLNWTALYWEVLMFRSLFHKHEDHSKLETHLNTMRCSPTIPLTTTSVINVSTCVMVPSTTGIWHFTLSHSVISLCLQEVCLNELHFTAVTNCHSEFLIACGSL